jgi:hypothetical protein
MAGLVPAIHALGAYLAGPFGGGWQTLATKPIDQPIDLDA